MQPTRCHGLSSSRRTMGDWLVLPASLLLGLLLLAAPGTAQGGSAFTTPGDDTEQGGGRGMPRRTRFVAEPGFILGVPRDELADFVDGNAYGFDFILGVEPATLPILIGVQGGWMSYGEKKVTVRDGGSTIEGTLSNRVATSHVLLRIDPGWGLSPYAEGLAGFKYFYTRTKDSGGGPVINDRIDLSDFAWSWGLGGGLVLRGPHGTRLTTGVRYLWGSEASYLPKGENARVAAISSNTDILTFQISFGAAW